MFLLDTNHLKELAYPTPLGDRLRGRLLQSGAQVFTTVITLEEELRGVLARPRNPRRQHRLKLHGIEMAPGAFWCVIRLGTGLTAAGTNHTLADEIEANRHPLGLQLKIHIRNLP
jgi:hypothetical protein